MRTTIGLFGLVMSLAACEVSRAGIITTYNDPALYAAATDLQQVINFDEVGNVFPLTDEYAALGVTFERANGGPGPWRTRTGPGIPTGGVVQVGSSVAGGRIVFSEAISAFSMLSSLNSFGLTQTMRFYFQGQQVGDTVPLETRFRGYVLDTPFDAVSIDTGFTEIQRITFDQIASNAVPEPTSGLLLGIGALGISAFVRRRSRRPRSVGCG